VPLSTWQKLSYTTGIAVDAHNDLYVANFDDATVHEFGPDGKQIRAWTVAHGVVGPTGVALDHAGNVYVAMHRAHAHFVEKYSPSGRLLASLVPAGIDDGEASAGYNGPMGLSVDTRGDIVLTDPANGRLVKVSPTGKPLATITGDGLRTLDAPGSVATDSKDGIYTSNDGILYRFDPAGHVTGEWFLPYGYMASLLIDASDRIWLIDDRIVQVTIPGS
jgi:streptogramin lyase